MKSLDALLTSNGSDQGSLGHFYSDIFQRYFDPIKDEVKSVLEIGVQFGASLKAWHEYFPNAKIYGVDVVDNGVDYKTHPRIEFVYADAGTYHGCETIKSKGPFDIILDDGSHYNGDIINTFQGISASVNKGGLYIITDLHATYHRDFNNQPGPNAMDFLKDRIDDVNWRGVDMSGSRSNVQERSLNEFERTIEFMHFWKSLCIIGVAH